MRTQGYCPNCKRQTMWELDPPSVNHLLHLLVTVFLCGAWLPVWLLLAVFARPRFLRCTACGFSQEEADAGKAGVGGVLMMLLQVVGIGALTMVMVMVGLFVLTLFVGNPR